MKVKKLYILVTIGMLFSLLLGACGSPAQVETAPTEEESEADVTSPTEEMVTEEEKEAGEVVEIVFQRYEGIDEELTYIDEFNASHPNIHVTVDTVPAADAYQKILLTTEAGNPPDVYMSHFTISSATNGLALDLTSLVEEAGSDWENDISDKGWVFHDYAGSHYAVPWRVSMYMFFINNKLREKAGLSLPDDNWTWDDFLEYAQAMTNSEEEEYGFCLVGAADSATTTSQFAPFLYSAGGTLINDEGLSALNTQPTIDTLNFINSLIHEYEVFPPGTASAETNTCTDLLGADKVAMWSNADLWRGTLRKSYPDIDISVVPYPQKETMASTVGGTGLAISPKSEHPEEAFEFIKFMTSPEIERRWSLVGGFMPPNISLWEDPDFIAEDPEREDIVRIFEETKAIYPYEGFPDGFNLSAIERNYLQAVYTEQMTPEDAMAAAAAEWDAILVDYQADNWWDAWME